MKFNYIYLVSSILILLYDSIYLKLFKNYFAGQVKSIQNSPISLNISAVMLSYLFIIIGFNYFVLGYNMSLSDSFLLGIIIYGIYETTNWAIFKKWSVLSVIIDTLWGGCLFLLTNWTILFIKGLFSKK